MTTSNARLSGYAVRTGTVVRRGFAFMESRHDDATTAVLGEWRADPAWVIVFISE
jgi:hypothetical protein